MCVCIYIHLPSKSCLVRGCAYCLFTSHGLEFDTLLVWHCKLLASRKLGRNSLQVANHSNMRERCSAQTTLKRQCYLAIYVITSKRKRNVTLTLLHEPFACMSTPKSTEFGNDDVHISQHNLLLLMGWWDRSRFDPIQRSRIVHGVGSAHNNRATYIACEVSSK